VLEDPDLSHVVDSFVIRWRGAAFTRPVMMWSNGAWGIRQVVGKNSLGATDVISVMRQRADGSRGKELRLL
jgi:hypothetical protein